MRFINSQKLNNLFILLTFLSLSFQSFSQHNSGIDCFTCHTNLTIGGTVFTDTNAINVQSGINFALINPIGDIINAGTSDLNGNISYEGTLTGQYLLTVGNITSRTWHFFPEQASCNICHIPGGNGSTQRSKKFHEFHTRIPNDNDCTHCHHFPATMNYSQLRTTGVLNAASSSPRPPESYVIIDSTTYFFNPDEFSITTVRPDIFASGYYSMFDVILAVAEANSINLDYYWDNTRKTHFINSVNGDTADYWYHFSYNTPTVNTEINYKRANRWDEALWRPGVWIKLVNGENLNEIKTEYLQEIQRENTFGHMIPTVRIALNPSDYEGNPIGSDRVTVTRTYNNLIVTPHNKRATSAQHPYSKPFQPGVATSIDILYSLMDMDSLTIINEVLYSHFGGNYIDSYYVVEMGFPGIGTAHSSGRQGFTYTTENGTPGNLPNNADGKLHMTSDINVIHAPDFSKWSWTELGDPYYESVLGYIPFLSEDYNAISLGFNLHQPYPNPIDYNNLQIIYNLFEPDNVKLEIVNIYGKSMKVVYEGYSDQLGLNKFNCNISHYPNGVYCIKMQHGNRTQSRKIMIVN